MRAATRVQETPCTHLTTSVYNHLISIWVPEYFDIMVETVSSPSKRFRILRRQARYQATVLTCWDDDTQQTLLSCIVFIYIHIHVRGRPLLLGFFYRERRPCREILQDSQCILVYKKKKKEKNKDEQMALSTFSVFSCAFLKKRLSFCQ